MRRALAPMVVLSLAVSPAWAESGRLMVTGSGSCSDASMEADLAGFEKALQQPARGRVVDAQAVHQRLGVPAAKTEAELQRQVDAAQMQFYEAQYAKSERQAEEALAELQRLPASDERVRLLVQTQLLLAQVYREQRRFEASDQMLEQVLRLAPTTRLDPDFFAPSVRARFEKLRRELERAPRGTLIVTSKTAGAEVFVSGVRVGATPYSGAHPRGTWSVELRRGGEVSLPHRVDLGAKATLSIDLSFEARIRRGRVPCLLSEGDDGLRDAAKLATLVGAEQVVVLRQQRREHDKRWLQATLLSVTSGQKVREGGLALSEWGDGGLEELAAFVATGKGSERVVATPMSAEPLRISASAHATQAAEGTRPWSKAAVGLGGFGVAALGTAAVLQVFALNAQAEFNRAYENGALSGDDEAGKAAASAARSRAKEFQAFAYTGVAVGATAIAGATALQLLQPKQHQSVTMAWSPTSGGGVLFVRWQR